MCKTFENLSFAIIILIFTITINSGCVLTVIEQNENVGVVEKPQQSIFTVINITDVKNPSIISSIHLPFRSGLNNNVILSDQYAYVTTETELLVIDVSNPQQPSYQTSISFPEAIGKAHISDKHVIVASKNKFYLVDCSNPLQPALQSQASLHHSNEISKFDIHDSYLYVKDVNDYIHIYHLANDNFIPVKSVEIEFPSGLVGVKAMGEDVKQIVLKHRTASDSSWSLVTDATDLLEFNCVHPKVRSSNGHLVFASRRYPCDDITIVLGRDRYTPFTWKWIEDYNLEANYLAHLYLTGKKILPKGIPTDVLYDNRYKIQFVSQDQWTHTIEYEPNQLLGILTDFQIYENFLYVVNSKGFLSILDLDVHKNKRFISAITIQSQQPSSLAVEKNHVYMLAVPIVQND